MWIVAKIQVQDMVAAGNAGKHEESSEKGSGSFNGKGSAWSQNSMSRHLFKQNVVKSELCGSICSVKLFQTARSEASLQQDSHARAQAIPGFTFSLAKTPYRHTAGAFL